jgi:hypothetical protein
MKELYLFTLGIRYPILPDDYISKKGSQVLKVVITTLNL